MLGIYCYVDKKDNSIVYVGKDSHIDEKARHNAHNSPSKYDQQQINRVLQNNPNRYIYKRLWEIEDCTNDYLNAMEMFYTKLYNPRFSYTYGGDGMFGFKHSEESKKKMSESKKGKNHHVYGKHHSEEHKRKISEARNTSGYYRVYKEKNKRYKQGFIWGYLYYENRKRKKIRSVDINKLKEKVLARGLKWEEF